MLHVYFTFAVGCNFFESATFGILVRVGLAPLVHLVQGIELSTNVRASITNSGIFIDHNLILGRRCEITKLNFASNSIARVLIHFDHAVISFRIKTVEFTEGIDRFLEINDDILNIWRRILFKRTVPRLLTFLFLLMRLRRNMLVNERVRCAEITVLVMSAMIVISLVVVVGMLILRRHHLLGRHHLVSSLFMRVLMVVLVLMLLSLTIASSKKIGGLAFKLIVTPRIMLLLLRITLIIVVNR